MFNILFEQFSKNDLCCFYSVSSPYYRRTTGCYMEWNIHHRGIFYNCLFYYGAWTTKRLVLTGSKALRLFRSVFLRRKSSPSFTNHEWNNREGGKGEFPEFLTPSLPNSGWRWIILASLLSRPALPLK